MYDLSRAREQRTAHLLPLLLKGQLRLAEDWTFPPCAFEEDS